MIPVEYIQVVPQDNILMELKKKKKDAPGPAPGVPITKGKETSETHNTESQDDVYKKHTHKKEIVEGNIIGGSKFIHKNNINGEAGV